MVNEYELLLRLLLAVMLGDAMGFDRERKTWVADLRTYMLVCLGSYLAMTISMYAFFDVAITNKIMVDPSRIAAGVMSGVGFLGAGTSIFYKNQFIKGLTTAAGLWTVSAIGLGLDVVFIY